MGAKLSSSKKKGNKNASNNKLSNYERPKCVYTNGQSSIEYFSRIEEPTATQFFTPPVPPTYHSSRVTAKKEPEPQVLSQRVSLTGHTSRVIPKREPVPQVLSQRVSLTDHTSRVTAMKELEPQVLSQKVSLTDHSSRVIAKKEPELQVFSKGVSSIDYPLREPVMKESAPQVFTQSVSFTYDSAPHSSRVTAKIEVETQAFSKGVSSLDHSSREPVMKESVPQVSSQMASLTNDSSRKKSIEKRMAHVLTPKSSSKVPAKRKSVPKVSNQKVSQTDHSSNVSEKKESEPQFLSNGLLWSVSSSREPVPQTFNMNKMKKALPINKKNSKYSEDYILSIILEWNTEWLTESDDSEEPNQLSPFGVGTGIKTFYNSLEEYQSAYIPLILIETWAQLYSDFSGDNSFGFKAMRAPDNQNDKKRTNYDNFMKLNLHTVVSESKIDDYPRFGHILILELATDNGHSNKPVLLFGYVVNLQKKAITENIKLLPGLVVPENCENPYLLKYGVKFSKESKAIEIRQNQMITVKGFYYLKQTMRHIELLSNLGTSPLLKSILKPHHSASELVIPTNTSLSCDNLNLYQSRAILGISQAVNSPYDVPKLVFIQGPPGTGKTFTLIETLKHIYMNCESEKRLPHILICAPSNGAVSEISKRVYKEREFLLNHPMERFRRELRCVRVGIEAKIQGEDRTILLEQLVKDVWRVKRDLEKKIKELDTKIEKLSEEMDNYSPSSKWKTDAQKQRVKLMDECSQLREKNQNLKIESEHKIKRNIMENADIVLTTLNSSHSFPIEQLFLNYGSNAFDCVIVDEASQCSEPELLMPLVYQMSKMILIGDPKQLPATVISKKASRLDFGRSLFERFYDHFLDCEQNNPNQKSPVLMLTEQFRMHPQICQFPSKQFYGGKLTTSSEVMKRNFNRLKPYILFDVTDTIEKSDEINKSFLNLKEANFVIRLLKLIDQMLNKSENNGKGYTVGIITPYNGQKTHLNEKCKLKYKRFNNIVIDVNTVDGFQGQEKDIIIYSSVRAFAKNNNNKSIGFLDSVQRMNVALTRAKHSMILCISGHTLKRDNTWKSLIDDSIKRTNIRFKVSSTQNQEIKKILAPIQ